MTASGDLSRKIRRVVVLVLEDRSFDHMLGYVRSPGYPIDGLTGNELNRFNPADPASERVYVSSDAPYQPDLDPSPTHDVRDVTVQLYGSSAVPEHPTEHNNGFVFDYAQITGNTPASARRIMQCFDPSKLPALATLARTFALCDHWYSSVPGPTWPNRLFVHAATSDGFVDNNPHPYDVRTIQQSLADQGLSWRVYFHDIPQALALANLRSSPGNFALYEEAFARDCANGTLPSYAFIEPRYFDFLWLKANDQHPPRGVVPGELLLAEVYEAIRRSPLWERCVLVVLWDEHGGIYDHVLPPGAPNPDGKVAAEFDFTRLGVRVPAVIASPYVRPGTVDSAAYDHTSVLAFLKRLFGLPDYLTRRDAAAASFEGLFALDAPRRDAPASLPRPSPVDPRLTRPANERTPEAALAAGVAGQGSTAPLSDLQKSLVALSDQLPIAESPRLRAIRPASATTTEHEGALRVMHATTRFLEGR